MTNFLQETIECLKENGKTEKDVLWVGRGVFYPEETPYKSTWEDFKSKADFEYDSGFGLNVIASDLIITGEDFWMERREYDGAEWWEFKIMPQEPMESRELVLLEDFSLEWLEEWEMIKL